MTNSIFGRSWVASVCTSEHSPLSDLLVGGARAHLSTCHSMTYWWAHMHTRTLVTQWPFSGRIWISEHSALHYLQNIYRTYNKPPSDLLVSWRMCTSEYLSLHDLSVGARALSDLWMRRIGKLSAVYITCTAVHLLLMLGFFWALFLNHD